MSKDIAIRLQNLTKIYHIYDKAQDRLKEALNPFKRSYHHDFYAVKDISFEISKGDVIGIIGKNGAGKSTLLKMITGVLTPTSGTIEVNGKIASLLELGAGFNPEMTGLENIYLNGSLLGITREEMSSRIDSVIEFADIGEFILQPVKMYSSGMFARLAFSVSINVNPEILIIDEALSVGDIRFQQKCLRKMNDMKENGCTILFVSHDMTMIKNLCKKAILIDDGVLQTYGSSNEVCELYFDSVYLNKSDVKELSYGQAYGDFSQLEDVPVSNYTGDGRANILKAGFVDSNGNRINTLVPGDWICLQVVFDIYSDLFQVGCGLLFKDEKGIEVFGTNTFLNGNILSVQENTQYHYEFKFKMPNLVNKKYLVDIALSEGSIQNHEHTHWVHDLLDVDVFLNLETFNTGLCVALNTSDIEYEKIKAVRN